LEQYQVQAKLIVPILHEAQLWGLLMALLHESKKGQAQA
jgi:GAF domain-containing protein